MEWSLSLLNLIAYLFLINNIDIVFYSIVIYVEIRKILLLCLHKLEI